MRTRKAALAILAAVALAGRAVAAIATDSAVAMPLARGSFQAAVAAQMREYFSLAPGAGLARLESLSSLPVQQFPALAADCAAARTALALIVSPHADALRDDRETRIVLSRALGKANIASISDAARELRVLAAADPGLAAALERLRAGIQPRDGVMFSDIAEVRANLEKLFDRTAVSGFEETFVDGRPILIPVQRSSGLIMPPVKPNSALGRETIPEGDAFVVRETEANGRVRQRKYYPKDAVSFERREIPSALTDVYAELPNGAVRQKKSDPLATALAAADIDLWTVRHGETESNREQLLAGSGIDSALTATLNERGTSGEVQARDAALKIYANLGGDAWARSVLMGLEKPVVILTSSLKRARQTASAFAALLDEKRDGLGADPSRRLYESRVERGLAEIAFGDFEGRPIASARTLEAWSAFDGISGTGRTFLDRFPKGESRLDVIVRQRGVLRRMIKDYPGRQVVTFAHFETVSAQKAILGLLKVDAADKALRVTPIPNAEPIRLTFPGAVVLGVR